MMLPREGIVLIDKPAGMTSFGVVARVRRVLSSAHGTKIKVGHTGTLDPFATGLMILVIGATCRQSEQFLKLDKWYEATIRLGEVSSTGDPEGEKTKVSTDRPGAEAVQAVLQDLTGDILQTPPVFSAIKVGGRRAYDLARAGKEVVLPPRKVTVYALEMIDYQYPLLQIRTHVSSGTYIRSMAQAIGEQLGTGAYCQALRRTRIADYDVAQAYMLKDLGIHS